MDARTTVYKKKETVYNLKIKTSRRESFTPIRNSFFLVFVFCYIIIRILLMEKLVILIKTQIYRLEIKAEFLYAILEFFSEMEKKFGSMPFTLRSVVCVMCFCELSLNISLYYISL